MKIMKVGMLDGWKPVIAGQIETFAANGYRKSKFEVNANGYVEVWAADNKQGKNAVLIGVATDEIRKFEFSYKTTQFVQFKFEKSTTAFVKLQDLELSVERETAASFTKVEPMSARNRHVDALEMMARYNQKLLQQQMAAQAAKIKQLEASLNVSTDNAVVEEKTKGQEPVGDVGAEQAPADSE